MMTEAEQGRGSEKKWTLLTARDAERERLMERLSEKQEQWTWSRIDAAHGRRVTKVKNNE